MPADASIYGLIQQPKQRNALEDAASVMQLQHAMGANALNSYQLAKAQREDQNANALADVYKSALSAEGNLDRGKVLSGAASRGLGAMVPDIQKKFADADKATGEVEKQKMEIAKQRTELAGQAFGQVRANPTVENAHAALDFLQTNGVMPAALVAQYKASVTPQNAAQFADQMFRSALATKDQLAKYETRNTGATTDTLSIDPVTGQSKMVNSVKNTVSPDAALSAQTQRRGQDMTDQRMRDQNTIQQGQKVQSGVVELRKEFNALPEVKNYKEVLPVMESVRRAPNTPAGDIDVIYGVGKVMDPNSVVREGEMTLAIKAGSPAQRLEGLYNYVKGGGRLSPSQRQELLGVMESRTQGLRTNYDSARKTYETAADRQGLPKDQIFIDNAVGPVSLGQLPSGNGGAKVVDFGSLK